MIDNPDTYGSAAGYVVGGLGLAAVIAQMAWARFFTKEGKGNDALIGQLTDRIVSLEARQTKQEADLDEERRLRRFAETKVHALELDNVTLRAELAKHNINVPPARYAAG